MTTTLRVPLPMAPGPSIPCLPAVSARLGEHLQRLMRLEQERRDQARERELARLRRIQQFD